MNPVAIYNVETGKIRQVLTVGSLHKVDEQLRSGEEFYLNVPCGATHIENGIPIVKDCNALTTKDMSGKLRIKRGILLSNSDWTQVSDSPLSPEKKAEWATYRQALRDFPATCDPSNPVWPVPPQ